MNLLDYIRGNRKGENAHRIEKESMQDPFLQEALEGFDLVDDDHMARMGTIRGRINTKGNQEQKRKPVWTSIVAAAIVVIAVVSFQFLFSSKRTDIYAQAPAMQTPIDIYIPEAYYTENIAIIAQKNTELSKDLSVKVGDYKQTKKDIATRDSANDLTLKLDSAKEEEMEPIQIFVPSDTEIESIK